MKKFVAIFLIAVVAMAAVFAEQETSTVTLTATRKGEIDCGFYHADDDSYKSKVTSHPFNDVTGKVSVPLTLYVMTNYPSDCTVQIYATGFGRDGVAGGDVVPLTMELNEKEFKFTGVPNGNDPSTGTNQHAPYAVPLTIVLEGQNTAHDLEKDVVISADFSSATAGSYSAYVTVVASTAE